METKKSNDQLQLEVRGELGREPSIDSDAIGITADHGLVFLSGHVLGVTQRLKAEEAAIRVDGVRALIDELRVRTDRWDARDASLGCAATDSLKWLIGLPDGRVKVIVRDGKVRLKGTVSRPDEKELIEAIVRDAIGRESAMEDAILIEPGAVPAPGPSRDRTMPLPEASAARIVVGHGFTDEGIPISHAHHRNFPEIRGEGESCLQGVDRLAQHLARAREHAREAWQREEIEHAIPDVRAYHSNLDANATTGRPGDRRGLIQEVVTPPMGGAIH